MVKKTLILELFKKIYRIRRVENKIASFYSEWDMRCPIHLSIGQEAVAAGVCQNLKTSDKIISSHRCHAHYIAKGGSLDSLLGELYGKKTGTCMGIGGSMHMYDKSVNHLASVPIVGGSIPIGVGIGYALKINNTKQVSVIYFGDAATEEGVFFESLHFAALKKLPDW